MKSTTTSLGFKEVVSILLERDPEMGSEKAKYLAQGLIIQKS